jgi:hypothetical protein
LALAIPLQSGSLVRLLLASTLLVWSSSALAQSPFHALEKPLPDLRSPMPSLPPPVAVRPPEPKSGLIANGDGTYRWEGLTFVAHVDADGRIHFQDHGGWTWVPMGASFDVTDWFMRMRRDDPYRPAKQKVVDVTFGDRARLRAAADATIMRAALDDLPQYLFAVWRERRVSRELRRRILFELWDECAEDGNALMVFGGDQARRTIEAFVRAHLPPEGPHAYTYQELERLNGARTSRARFSPYLRGQDDVSSSGGPLSRSRTASSTRSPMR